MTRNIKYVATAARWFDRANGNTYHNVRITRLRDETTLASGMTYGYDDAYRQTALELMATAKWLPVKYRGHDRYLYERENNYPILWTVTDGTKRDMLALTD